MKTPSTHSFVRLRDAMRALAAWLDVPASGQSPGASAPEALRALCAAGLRCLADNAEEYDRLIDRPNAFGAEQPAAGPSGERLDDTAFMLVEDMAALFRERILREPEAPPRDVEQALLAHFERCGEWLPADGTTVTDWYYVRLPALVLAQLLRRAEAATRAARPPGS